MTDLRLLLTASQLRMARAAVRQSADQIATLADVSAGTLRRLEKGEHPTSVTTTTLDRLQCAYERLGVVFDPDDGRGAGVRMKD